MTVESTRSVKSSVVRIRRCNPARAEKGAESRPFQQHTWFVAYGVAVVIRRDVVDIVRPEVEYRAVLELRAEPTREHHPDVVRLTPVSPDNGPRVGGPSPARFLDRATDRQVAQVNQILGDPGEPDCVIRCPQVLERASISPMVNRLHRRSTCEAARAGGCDPFVQSDKSHLPSCSVRQFQQVAPSNRTILNLPTKVNDYPKQIDAKSIRRSRLESATSMFD